ncbi:MAG TPA: hypothetical protein VMG12_07530 [Polyangiaceae bacterium]|nr:hypothetical protein [Polyangiaceae bacterium]
MRPESGAPRGVLAGTLAASALIGCTTAAPPRATPAPASANPSPTGVDRFLPLRDGFVLNYWVSTAASAEREQVIFRVERHSSERASLRTGNRTQRLELAPDGVRLLSGGYLLRAPLALGAEWTGPVGRVRVSAVDTSVDVDAGHFVGCVETTEVGEAGPDERTIVTSYCPDVGITLMRVEAGEREERFELRSYGPSVDINAM